MEYIFSKYISTLFIFLYHISWLKRIRKEKNDTQYDTTLKELLEVTDPDVELRLATEEERRMESLLKNL